MHFWCKEFNNNKKIIIKKTFITKKKLKNLILNFFFCYKPKYDNLLNNE